jgi:hypothetical protein
VSEIVDVCKSEHRRQSLEAVGGAEHVVHQLLVASFGVIFVECADPIIQLQQVFVESIE